MRIRAFAIAIVVTCAITVRVAAQVLETNELPPPQVPPVTPAVATEEAPAPQDGPLEELQGEPIQRGPIHEAFAEPLQLTPTATPVRPQPPPPAVHELPPEADPDAKNLQWIPGYWAWDEQRSDYVWVSGVWRKIPQGRDWINGTWETTEEGGHRWVPGYWLKKANDEAETAVVPLPPDSLEEGPTSPAPSEDHFWIPGTWKLNEAAEYVWRPGFWTRSHVNWVWVPEHYVWRPSGCIHVSGYWDYTWERRGTLYAPCTFPLASLSGRYYYRPSYVLSSPLWLAHLWVGPGSYSYYYGDYGSYLTLGYSPWYDYYGSHVRYYDPFYTYYRWRFPAAYGIGLYGYLDGLHSYYRRSPGNWPAVSLYGADDWRRHHSKRYPSVYGDVSNLYRRIDPDGTRRYRSNRGPGGITRSDLGSPRNLGGARPGALGRENSIDAYRRSLGLDAERRRGRLRQDSLVFPDQQRGLRSSPSGASGPSSRSERNPTTRGSFRNLPSRSPGGDMSPRGLRNLPSGGGRSNPAGGSFRNLPSRGPSSPAGSGSFRNLPSRGSGGGAAPGGFRNQPSRGRKSAATSGSPNPSPRARRESAVAETRPRVRPSAPAGGTAVTKLARPSQRSAPPAAAASPAVKPTPGFSAHGMKKARGEDLVRQREAMQKRIAGRK